MDIVIIVVIDIVWKLIALQIIQVHPDSEYILLLKGDSCYPGVCKFLRGGITWFWSWYHLIWPNCWSYLPLSWKLSWVEQVNKLCLFHSTFEPGLTRLRITGISRPRYIHHHLYSWSPNSTLISTDKYKRHSRHRYIHQTPSLIIIPLMIVTGQHSSSN